MNTNGSREVEDLIQYKFHVRDKAIYNKNLPIVTICFKCDDNFLNHGFLREMLTENHYYKILDTFDELNSYIIKYGLENI